MDFFQKIRVEWEQEIKPILEDVYASIEQMDGGIMFKRHGPTDLYTKIYKITTDYQFDFRHIDFLYYQEIGSIVEFCKKYSIEKSLREMIQHFNGFDILVRWFHCFFHHLHRFRHQAYSKKQSVGHDMALAIRTHYIRPQKSTIQSLVRSTWDRMRSNNHKMDLDLMEAMEILRSFDPFFYEQLYIIYLETLQEKSKHWFQQTDQLVYMEQVVSCFRKEEEMFLDCFDKYHDRKDQVTDILRNTLVRPFHTKLLHHDSCGWKAVLRSHHIANIKTAYCFFSHVPDCSLWSVLYQEFLEEETTQRDYEELAHFFQDQIGLIKTIFIDETLRLFFLNVVQTKFQTIFQKKPSLVVQMTQTLHHQLMMHGSSQTIKKFSRMMGFCPDRDVFYQHYHHHLRIRLLSGYFDPLLENQMLDYMSTQFGASFALNMRLMLSETQSNCLHLHQARLFKLSKIVWDFKHTNGLVYKPPSHIVGLLSGLSKSWREETDRQLRLEDMWLRGVVVVVDGEREWIMEPIQAIVLMACEGGKSYPQLVSALEIMDDETHNLQGVLDSIEKTGLVRKEEEVYSWCRPKNGEGVVVVTPIREKKKSNKTKITPQYAVEAFIVRIMKQEKTKLMMPLLGIVRKQYQSLPLREIKKIIENLVDRDFLSRTGEKLGYLP